MDRQEQTEYFKKSLNFIKERYGEENLISATIHYDERTPHMHVNFVPVTQDGRLSAKDLFSPKSLRVLQDDYNRYVRENGYDLQRGEIDSKSKHLEVEQYKIDSKYAELKAKEQELEKLEQIDKSVDLNAEKGKLTYSTKEVEAIKEQNRSLKIDNYQKEKEIQTLHSDIDRARNRLIQAQNELKGRNIQLERLKELESENRALQELRKVDTNIDKAMERFDKLKARAYDLGNKMVECKKIYHSSLEEREKLINYSCTCEKTVQNCDSKISDIKTLEMHISGSLVQENSIRTELERLTGIFKKKARDDCKQRLEKQEQNTLQLLTRLQENHNIIKPEHIRNKIDEYNLQKQQFTNEKAKSMQQTDELEIKIKQAVDSYKSFKILADCQQEDLKNISERISSREKLRPGEEKTFRLTQNDREQFLKEYNGKVSPKIIEICKQNFEKQDIQERQERMKSRSSSKMQYETTRG